MNTDMSLPKQSTYLTGPWGNIVSCDVPWFCRRMSRFPSLKHRFVLETERKILHHNNLGQSLVLFYLQTVFVIPYSFCHYHFLCLTPRLKIEHFSLLKYRLTRFEVNMYLLGCGILMQMMRLSNDSASTSHNKIV